MRAKIGGEQREGSTENGSYAYYVTIFNDKEDVLDPIGKFAQRIHCRQVMQIYSDQCVQHSFVIYCQIFPAFDLHTFWIRIFQKVCKSKAWKICRSVYHGEKLLALI